MKHFNFLLIAPLALLTACSNQFDFSKKAPDEFAVVTRAPLEMPSSYDLPAPTPGAQRPQESSPEETAKQALFGDTAPAKTTTASTGENILLQKAGATETPDNIRAQIDIETQKLADENMSTVNRILGKAGKTIDAPAEVIDPIKERERLILEQQK